MTLTSRLSLYEIFLHDNLYWWGIIGRKEALSNIGWPSPELAQAELVRALAQRESVIESARIRQRVRSIAALPDSMEDDLLAKLEV